MKKRSDVLSTICMMLPSLSASEHTIAQYIIDHPDQVINTTVRELAKRTGTSPATVSRFSRRLRYTSFTDLRTALAITIGQSEAQAPQNDFVSLDDFSTSIQEILKVKISELEETAQAINHQEFKELITMMRGARQVMIAAVGNTITTAENASFKFNQAGIRAIAHPSIEATISASINLGSKDVLLVLTSSGYSKRLVSVYDNAEDSGTPIVLITDALESPLVERSTFVIHTTTKDTLLAREARFSQNSMNFIIELMFLFFLFGSEDSIELNRILYRNLIADRLYEPTKS